MRRQLLLTLAFCSMVLLSQAQWVQQATGFPNPSRGIRSICAVDTNVVWATAYDGVTPTNEIQEFTRTLDGGNTWVPGVISGYTGWGLSMICAVDGMKAWIPAWNPAGGGAILYTSDGGTTWTPQSSATFDAPAGFPNVVHFWDADSGFCMGDPNGGYFEIYTTVNGGTTWTRVPQADIPANLASEWGVVGYYDVVGDNVWFTTGKGRVFKSTDRGYHWTVASTPNTTKQMQISMRSALSGIVQINEAPYTAYQTQDGGMNWTLLTPIGNFFANDFCYIPGTASTYISVGADINNFFNGVSYSSDDGAIWDDFIGSDTGQFLAVDFTDPNHGWAGAFNTDAVTGGMWKYTGSIFTTDPCAGFGAYFSQSADTVDLATSAMVSFTDLSAGNPSVWSWNFGDGGNSSSQNPSHTYTATGVFYVYLEINDGGTCYAGYTDSVVVVNTSGISGGNLSGIEIWPNPASDFIHISTGCIPQSIEILDSRGLVLQRLAPKDLMTEIDVSTLSKGLYFIRIQTSGKSATGRFIRM